MYGLDCVSGNSIVDSIIVATAWINLGTVLSQSPVDHDANVNVAHPR